MEVAHLDNEAFSFSTWLFKDMIMIHEICKEDVVRASALVNVVHTDVC